MESLSIVRPLGCDFQLKVPTRHINWYTQLGYEPFSTAVFRRSCSWADDVIDIGAHMGYYSLLAASTNPAARVVAVEASPDNAVVARENAHMNGCERIEVVSAAFSDSDIPVQFHLAEASDNSGRGNHPNSPTVGKVEVEAVTGRELDIEPGRKLLIKIDVEGYEIAALRGLEDVLNASAEARILVEFNPKCIRPTGVSPTAILEWLESRGFRLFALDEGEFRWQEVDVETIEHSVGDGYLNIWCVQRDKCVTISAVLHSSGLSGAERSHVETVASLVAMGCMVQTILPSPDLGLVSELKLSGSSLALIEKYPWWVDASGDDLSSRDVISSQIRDAIAEVNPDVVLTETLTVPQGAFAAASLNKPHVWWIREFGDLDYDLRFPGTPAEFGKLVLSLSDLVLTMSEAVKQHFFPGGNDFVHVVRLKPRIPRDEFPRRGQNEVPTIGVIASLAPGKGHEDAIRAIAHPRFKNTPLRLRFIGHGSDEQIANLRQLGQELGVDGHIDFTGTISNRTDVYGPVDIVAVTSRSEAFGRIPFEATAAGRPVIYSTSGGMVEYMVPGVTGLSYEPGDVVGLAEQIALLIADEALQATLVTQAQAHFSEFFNENELSTTLRDRLADAIALHQKREHGREDVRDIALKVAHTLEARLVAEKSLVGELSVQRDELVAQLRSLSAERDAIVAERDAVLVDRDAVLADRDAVVLERDEMRNSRLWRFAQPYRNLRHFIRTRL